MIKKLLDKYWSWQTKKEHQDIEDTYEFIWGIKSWDCLLDCECNMYTMNDITIIYNKKTKKYSISIETIYQFEEGREGEKKYIKKLFDMFTEWMMSQGYDVDQDVDIYDIFTAGSNIGTEFDSIEKLYSTFKYLVKGFVN